MIVSRSLTAAAALAVALLAAAGPARADYVLSFGQPAYTAEAGGTVDVQVFLSQTAAGPQVGPGNELLSAGISVRYDNPSGVAAVTLVTGGPAFDASSSEVTATNATLGLLSVAGIDTLPVLLGTFQFTGLAAGLTTISVGDLDPGSVDFITVNGDIPDPTGVATAQLTVTGVPEPGSFALVGLVAGGAAVGSRRVGSAGRRPQPAAEVV